MERRVEKKDEGGVRASIAPIAILKAFSAAKLQ